MGANLVMMAVWDIYRYEKLHVFAASNIFQFGLAWGLVTHLALKDASQKSKEFAIHFNLYSIHWFYWNDLVNQFGTRKISRIR